VHGVPPPLVPAIFFLAPVKGGITFRCVVVCSFRQEARFFFSVLRAPSFSHMPDRFFAVLAGDCIGRTFVYISGRFHDDVRPLQDQPCDNHCDSYEYAIAVLDWRPCGRWTGSRSCSGCGDAKRPVLYFGPTTFADLCLMPSRPARLLYCRQIPRVAGLYTREPIYIFFIFFFFSFPLFSFFFLFSFFLFFPLFFFFFFPFFLFVAMILPLNGISPSDFYFEEVMRPPLLLLSRA